MRAVTDGTEMQTRDGDENGDEDDLQLIWWMAD